MNRRSKQWYVLACEGGYVGNVFELFNNSPKRPRLAITPDLQEALIGTEGMLKYWRKQAEEVIGVESEPVPVRFENRKKTTYVVLDTKGGEDGKDASLYERTGRGRS